MVSSQEHFLYRGVAKTLELDLPQANVIEKTTLS